MHFPYVKFLISGNGLLLYSLNHKSGCSTIKKTINGKVVPPIKYLSLARSPIFTVVRNPYSRFLSSFRYCFLRRTNLILKEWSHSDLTIDNYLKVLEYHSEQGHFERFDPHQRPQYYNTCIDQIKYDFIGKLEKMKEVSDYTSHYGYKEVKTKDDHKTNSMSDYKNLLDSGHCSRIQKIFEKDFEVFGYSYDLHSSSKVESLVFPSRKFSFDRDFEMKILLESHYMLHDDKKFADMLELNRKFIVSRFLDPFGLKSGNYVVNFLLFNPVVLLMILSGVDFQGRLDQIMLSLVQPVEFERNLRLGDIDVIIKMCKDNGLSRFVDVLISVRKYCRCLKFESQYLYFKNHGNFNSLEYVDDGQSFSFLHSRARGILFELSSI